MTVKRIFFDTEFDGLRKDTTIISLGAVTDCGSTFYMENSDFNKESADPWVKENVLPHLLYNTGKILYNAGLPHWTSWSTNNSVTGYGSVSLIAQRFMEWVQKYKSFDRIELWADVKEYDSVLLMDAIQQMEKITGNRRQENIHYIIHEFATLLLAKGIDPDINRKEFAFPEGYTESAHNSLNDSIILKTGYEKVMS